MKNLLFILVFVGFCTSAALATFDFTILDTYEAVVTLNSQSLLIEGGGVLSLDAWGSSYIEVWGTTPLQQLVGGIYDMSLDDTSVLNYYGGETGAISIYDDASAVLEGGRIDYLASHQYLGQPHIEMIVNEYNFNAGSKMLTGLWGDDSAFSIELVNQSGYDPVIDNIAFTIVPEPATLSMMCLGILLLKKRRVS